MQDTSVQAMTEVALALSMAFFALLMLALLSMSANQASTSHISQETDKIMGDHLHEVLESEQGSVKPQQDFLFWHMGQLFEQDMTPLNKMTSEAMIATYLSENMQAGNELVLVVSQQTPVSEIRELQILFKAQEFALTVMTDEWEAAFEDR